MLPFFFFFVCVCCWPHKKDRLVASLRLLCRLSTLTSTSSRPQSSKDLTMSTSQASRADVSLVTESATGGAWKDPAIVAALVSFLPRTIRPGEQQVTFELMGFCFDWISFLNLLVDFVFLLILFRFILGFLFIFFFDD